MKVISEIRTDYSKATLDINSVDKNPIIQFQKWFEQALASQALEPNAMNLATLSEKGRPTSRIVLLKGIENEQFIFYTNYQSQKGRELELNPACALNFFWPELERQVRIEGVVSRVSADASDSYFQSRPRSSQVGAWASPQSTLIKERSILEERVVQIEKKYKDLKVLPRPKQWGGYGVTPLKIEFWQGRPNRLHDRIVYTLVDGKWKINRLAP
ncbi:MAG: pyridoxamine 5'-phosphate oxidase [Cyclobacteriaceae bacterium]|jgi:pyridoxamine 5'-phosphate oxidase|nr:pyridoxamine 5'-phosphate oxidase [Cyclobacteriaceae bacterium]